MTTEAQQLNHAWPNGLCAGLYCTDGPPKHGTEVAPSSVLVHQACANNDWRIVTYTESGDPYRMAVSPFGQLFWWVPATGTCGILDRAHWRKAS